MQSASIAIIGTIVCGLFASGARGSDPRADFLKLIDHPHVPLAAEVKEPTAQANGLVEIRFWYMAEAGQRVPGIIVKSASATGRQPVVIALHGTGSDKTNQLPIMRQLAGKGFFTVAIDGRYHGERSKTGKGSTDYQDAILRAWHEQKEHPFFFDTVWDVMRLVDYLETRDDVDAKRIGLYGVSKGGIETYLTAAVDPRITAAVPCIGVESFKWATENNSWQSRVGTIQTAFDAAAKESNVTNPDGEFLKKFYDRVAPGIYGEFDGPSMVPLIAPRPLLTINGDIDPRTPMPGLQECIQLTKKAYESAGAADHFLPRIQEKTGHHVNTDSEVAAVEWFVKWLKP